MNFSAVVDVVIGLAFVYLAASLLVTIFNEYIAQTLKLRGRALARSLQSLIDAPPIASALRKTSTLGVLMGEPGKPPSYVDPAVFADELLGALVAGASAPGAAQQAMTSVVGTIDTLPNGQLKTVLRGMAVGANNNVEEFKKAVGQWLDKSLTMLGEQYKRSVQLISLGVGIAIAVGFNIDTIHLTDRLYSDTALRQGVADFAAGFVAKTDARLIEKCTGDVANIKDPECAPIASLMKLITARKDAELKLPIGWGGEEATPHFAPLQLALIVLGWLLTGFAVSLGAAFWFDLLGKLVNVRYGMRKPEPKPEAA